MIEKTQRRLQISSCLVRSSPHQVDFLTLYTPCVESWKWWCQVCTLPVAYECKVSLPVPTNCFPWEKSLSTHNLNALWHDGTDIVILSKSHFNNAYSYYFIIYTEETTPPGNDISSSCKSNANINDCKGAHTSPDFVFEIWCTWKWECCMLQCLAACQILVTPEIASQPHLSSWRMRSHWSAYYIPPL